jgi:hypothetical protein
MWPSKWISDDVEVQALLARWRSMTGTRTEIWEYSCSHDRLLIRIVREKVEAGFQPLASAYLLCWGCQSVRFDPSWRGLNIHVEKDAKAAKPVCVVTDGERLHIVCLSVLVIETEVSPFIHLADELRGLSLSAGKTVNTLRIEYVMVCVSGESPEEISKLVGKVTEISKSHGGMISDILRALVIISFGDFPFAPSVRGKRAALVEHLSRELSGQLRIVHGATEAFDGKQEAMLHRLNQLEFGKVEELEK